MTPRSAHALILLRRRSRLLAGAATIAWLLLLAGCGGQESSEPESLLAFNTASFRDAARITGEAERQVLLTLRPGLFERDLKAVVDDVFGRAGVTLLAFPHLIGSGPNTLEPHYYGEARQIRQGDLVVVDIGATSGRHCADLTRTYPASGHFTRRQRQVYQLVLAAQQGAVERARLGGESLQSLDTWVRELFHDSPLRSPDADGQEQTMDTFFIHGLGHYIGRTVHGEDTGWETQQPFEPGQVLAIEPGLYLPNEGFGIRIEDDYLVTEGGLECLSADVPREVAEIERLMAEPRAPVPSMLALPPIPASPGAAAQTHMDFDRLGAPEPRQP